MLINKTLPLSIENYNRKILPRFRWVYFLCFVAINYSYTWCYAKLSPIYVSFTASKRLFFKQLLLLENKDKFSKKAEAPS
jgi:hypothetical protein